MSLENVVASSPATENSGEASTRTNMSGSQVKAFLLGTSKPVTEAPATPVEQVQPTVQPSPEELSVDDSTGDTLEQDTTDVLSQLHNLDPQTRATVERLVKESRARDQESINKRIGKEVAKTKSLEARLKELESAPPKEKEVPVPVALPTADSPLANINDKAMLQQEYKKAKEVFTTVDELLIQGPNDMGVFEVDGKEYTRDQLIQIRRNSAKMADDFIPQRYKFLEAKEQFSSMAKKEFPWMDQPESPEYRMMQEQRKSAPWLLNMPNADMLLGVFVEGLKQIQSKTTPNVAPITPPSRRPPSDQVAGSQQAASSTRASGISIQREAVQGSMAKMSKAGGVSGKDVARFLLNSDLSRTQ
jgi:hypothetical protein